MEQADKLDFKEIGEKLSTLSAKAQATFMYNMVRRLRPPMLRTTIRYCHHMLDRINDALPADDPARKIYDSYKPDIRATSQVRRPFWELQEEEGQP